MSRRRARRHGHPAAPPPYHRGCPAARKRRGNGRGRAQDHCCRRDGQPGSERPYRLLGIPSGIAARGFGRGRRRHRLGAGSGRCRLGAAQAPYCAQVPSSMVGSALRLPVGKQVTSVAGPVSVCAYLGKYEVLVRFQVGENAGEFTQSRTSLVSLHQSVSDVANLGDQAYFAIFGSGQRASNTLAARKGSIAIFVTAPTPLATERSLMTQLLAKV